MIWPLFSILIIIVLAVLYSLLIFYIIPSDAISELIIIPSLIIAAILYSIFLIKMHTILPKMQEKEEGKLKIEEWEEDLFVEMNSE